MSQCKAMQEIVLARGGEGDRVNRGNTVCIRAPLACRWPPRRGGGSLSPGQRPGNKGPNAIFFGPTGQHFLQVDGWPVGPLTGDRWRDSPPGRRPGLGERLGLRPNKRGEIFGTKSDTACPPLFTTLILIPFLWAVAAASYANAASLASFAVKNDVLAVRREGQSLQVSLKSPALVLGDKKISGHLVPQTTSGSPANGKIFEVCYAAIPLGPSASLEVKLFLRWSETESVLRKWATIRLVGPQASVLLKEVVLDDIETQDRPVWSPGAGGKQYPIFLDAQSHPVFLPGMFVGIEFPMAATRCENGHIFLADRPGVTLRPGEEYKTRTAVYGMTPVGREVQAFQQYIAAHRPEPRGFHVNYNSWWTAPIPATPRTTS